MSQFVHLKQSIGTINVPPSKSFAQRALFAAALSHSPIILKDIGQNDDVKHVVEIIQQLGCQVNEMSDQIKITPRVKQIKSELNVGESGLGTRLTVPIVGTLSDQFIINGKGSLLNRPMHWLNENLPQMGLSITLNKKLLPIEIKGHLKGGNYTVDGSLSSQYISGLLMALPLCKDDSTLRVTNPKSIPYIDITLQILKHFGISITHQNHEEYKIRGSQKYMLIHDNYQIEGDYSGAAFWIVYGLLNDGITITNLNPNSVQADKAILEVVDLVGGSYNWNNNNLNIVPGELKPFHFDATHCPDLFPILVTLAAAITGKSIISGTKRLVHKESNRTMVLIEEFSKLGLSISEKNEQLVINGKGKLNSGNINSNNDHRIAMAGAIASFLSPHGIYISNPSCVNKSYPEFWSHYHQNN